MTSPLKPWEMAGVNSRLADLSGETLSSSAPLPTSAGPSRTSVLAPALPPRPLPANNYGSNLGMMSTGYGGYSGFGGYGSSYGGLGGYGGGLGGYGGGLGGYGGGLGGYGGGYGGYGSYGGFGQFGGGMFGNAESRFIQLAEESSRPAFQSIQSVVGAVGSVAMMLENTFIAITSSFRAILGVADNFGRLRSLFAQFWSAFAVVRGINWLLKKLLVLMGIRTEDEFRAWAEAQAAVSGTGRPEEQQGGGTSSGRSSWPVILFLGIISIAPYIISKLLGSITSTINTNQASDPSTWQNPLRALAQYDFQATSPQELSFRANQVVTIAPESVQGTLWQSGWLMATVDNQKSGLIPANYVKLFRQNTPAIGAQRDPNVTTAPSSIVTETQTRTNAAAPAPLTAPEDTSSTIHNIEPHIVQFSDKDSQIKQQDCEQH